MYSICNFVISRNRELATIRALLIKAIPRCNSSCIHPSPLVEGVSGVYVLMNT